MVVLKASDPSAQYADAITSVHVDDNLFTGTKAGMATVRKTLKEAFQTTTNDKPDLVIGVQVE